MPCHTGFFLVQLLLLVQTNKHDTGVRAVAVALCIPHKWCRCVWQVQQIHLTQPAFAFLWVSHPLVVARMCGAVGCCRVAATTWQ